MNASSSDALVRFLGWYLADSLWLGALIAISYALFERLASRLSPNVRYAAACLALAMIVLAPAGLAAFRLSSPLSAAPTAGEYWRTDAATKIEATPANPRIAPHPIRTTWLAEWRGRLRDFAPHVVAMWLLGVITMGLRYALLWRTVRGLCTRDTHPPTPEILALLESVCARMGVAQPIQLLVSTRIDVPMVLGWGKTILLLPASVALHMAPAELEAIIAHELAHVRRHDWLVNFLQVFASTLLFFHPAVWWLGSRISAEREFCCDDLAAATSGGAAPYLRALIRLEELRATGATPALALGASGGSLIVRARRLTADSGGESRGAPASIIAFCLVGCVIAGWLFIAVPNALAQSSSVDELRALRERNRVIAGKIQEEASLRIDTPVTLEFKDAPLRNVLQAIARESHLQIVYPLADGLTPVTLSAEAQSAGDALDQLLDPLGLVWMPRGDLAVQVLPFDGSISPSHKLLRYSASSPLQTRELNPRGSESVAALIQQFEAAQPEQISASSRQVASAVLAHIAPAAPSTSVASRLIVQVERAPELERDVVLQVEITGIEYGPGAATSWVSAISNDPEVRQMLATSPQIFFAREVGGTREFSLLLTLAVP